MIVTKLPYSTVGAHPMTHVKSVSNGFDWEHGKFMIWPEQNLSPAKKELDETFKSMEKRASELFIKNMQLEKEIRRLKSALESKTNP